MFFYIKKSISYFFEPLTITFIILGIGLYHLFKKEPDLKKGRKFILSGTIFLFIISSGSFTYWLTAPFEQKYEAQKNPDPNIEYEFIHSLGSGHADNESLPANSRMGEQGLYRLTEAVRLHKLYPKSTIIFSGYGGPSKQSTAEVSAEIAMMMGVQKEKIIVLGEPRDTIEESRAAFEIIGKKPFFLVSSASHLTRSVGLFKKLGMNPTPAPTEFMNSGAWRFSLPDSGGLYKAERGIYEALGTAWAWLTGRL